MNQNPFSSNRPMGGPIPIRINLEDTSPFICPCGCEMFAEGMLLRKISAIISGGKGDVAPVRPITYCVKCFKPVPALLPPELKKDYIDIEAVKIEEKPEEKADNPS